RGEDAGDREAIAALHRQARPREAAARGAGGVRPLRGALQALAGRPAAAGGAGEAEGCEVVRGDESRTARDRLDRGDAASAERRDEGREVTSPKSVRGLASAAKSVTVGTFARPAAFPPANRPLPAARTA